MDCFRMAYAHSSWAVRDMALINMGNVLQEAGFTRDATHIFEMAIQVEGVFLVVAVNFVDAFLQLSPTVAMGYYAYAQLLLGNFDVMFNMELSSEFFHIATILDRSHPRMHFCYIYVACCLRNQGSRNCYS